MNAATFLIFLVFLVLAFRRIVGGAFLLTPRAWRAATRFGLSLTVLTLGACGSLFLLARPRVALNLSGQTLVEVLPHILAAWVFLLVALTTPKGFLPRLFPLIGVLRTLVRRTARRRFLRRRNVGLWLGTRLAEAAIYMVLMLAISAMWLRFAAHSEPIQASVSEDLADWVRTGLDESGDVFLTSAAVTTILAPFTEETIFRGFALQELALLLGATRLGKRRWAGLAAVFLAAAMWSVGHAGFIEPGWVKWVQIFGVGCVLGIARLRLGLEAAIVLHLGFNLLGGYFVPNDLLLPIP
ncbi:CPBP family intramembrane metalloprotease [Candidatus Sumerlaeota bacterium]|nr:CPBP family intramembrane metalloprotease [Candidatus Sumerlaeota bacterium]